MHHSTFPGRARALLVAGLLMAAATAGDAQSASPAVPSVAAEHPLAVTVAVPASELPSSPTTAPTGARPSADEAPASRSVLLNTRPAALTSRGAQRLDASSPAPVLKQERSATRTNTALMIVGAAAIVLGAAVGDEAGTVLIISGAGIGLYGLYRLLN
jgi:hypothetical protein